MEDGAHEYNSVTRGYAALVINTLSSRAVAAAGVGEQEATSAHMASKKRFFTRKVFGNKLNATAVSAEVAGFRRYSPGD